MAASPSQYDVAVIGSGMGGSTAAAVLAHAGVHVLLLEKNPRLGGSCSSYAKQGFLVDWGTHMFTRGPRGPIGAVQRRIGLPPARRVRFARPRFISELRGMGTTLRVPSAGWRVPRFLYEAVRAMEIPVREWPGVVRMFHDMLRMSEREMREWDDRTVDQFVLAYTQHPRLLGLFGFLLGLYFILPFWQVSAGEAIYCFTNMVRDNCLSYPLGGASVIPRTLCGATEHFGGRVEVDARVTTIEPSARSDGRLRVVVNRNHEYRVRAVVSTTSLKDLVTRLVGREPFPAEYAARVAEIRGSYVAVQCKIALARPHVRAGSMVGAVSRDPRVDPWSLTLDDFQRTYDAVENGRVPTVVPIYCPIPTNFDPSLGPAGAQLLTACAVAPTTDIRLEDDEKDWIQAMLRAMNELIPGMERDTLFVDTVGVRGLEAWIGKLHGPAVSTGQTTSQVGNRRPDVRTPVRGIYAAGDCAGGRGVGTELATASGMECADAILADMDSGLI